MPGNLRSLGDVLGTSDVRLTDNLLATSNNLSRRAPAQGARYTDEGLHVSRLCSVQPTARSPGKGSP
jgi:hypothetical protein